MPKRNTRRSTARRSARRSTARRSARRSTARRSTARRSARRSTARRSARRSTARRSTARRSARRSTARRSTARRSTARRTTARRSARRSTARRTTARRSSRKERVNAVSNILSAAYGIQRKRKEPVKKKTTTQDDVDSFLAGIETSGSFGLKEVFKGDDKNDRVAKRGPMKKRKPTPPKIPRNNRGKVVKDEETTGPLNPAAIKGNKVIEKKEKKEKKSKRRSGKKTTAWIEHVKEFYQEKKKVDKDYQYFQALKDAKKTYKKK
tara:strand:+ start:182 stop:973 length:792 start_codon:yes stop_codon:yes gene_type:complete